MRRAARLIASVLGVLISGAVLGVFAFAAWLLATTPGARWLLEWLPRAGLAQVSAEQLEGRLLGPLRVRGLRYVDDGIEVRLDEATLYWSPAALLDRTVRLDELHIGTLEVSIENSKEDSKPKPFRVPRLPVTIALNRVQLDRLSLQLPGSAAPQLVERVVGDALRWSPSRFELKHLSLHHAEFGSFATTIDAGLSASSVDVYTLLLIEDRGEGVKLSASGVIDLDQGDSSVLALEWLDLRWPLLTEAKVFSAKGKFVLEGTPDAFTAQGEFALGEAAQITASARYSPAQLQADLQWSKLQWPLTGVPRIASEKGRLEASGTPQNFSYVLDAQLAAEGQQGTATAAGTGGSSHVVVDRLRLAVAQSAIEGTARIHWQPEDIAALSVDADLRVKNLDPGLIDPAWPGRLNGTLEAQTQLRNDTPATQFELALAKSTLRGYPLILDAKGSSEGAVVVLDSLRLRSAGTELRASGQLTPPFDLKAKLDSPDLAALWPALSGRASLETTLSGTLAAPHVVASGSARSLKFGEWALDQLRFKADLELIGAWNLDLEADRISGPAALTQARIEVSGRDSEHQIQIGLKAPQADANLSAHGSFDRARKSWKGEVLSGRLAPADLAAWTLQEPAALQLDAASLHLEPMCWSAADSRVCASVDRDAGGLRAGIRLEQLDFAYLAPFLAPGWEVRGGIDGTGLVDFRGGQLAQIKADLSTDPSEVRRDGQILLKTERGSLLVSESAGSAVAKLDLPLQRGSLTFNGELGAGSGPLELSARPLSAQLDVRLDDLGFLRLATEEVEQVAGRIQGRMNFSGSLREPITSGDIALLDGRLKLATPGIEVQNIGVRIQSAASGALQISGAATSGGGTIRLEGEAQLGGDASSAKLELTGEEFQVANMTEARAWISPRMEVELTSERIEVRGDIDVPRANISPVSFAGGIAPSRDQVIVTSADTAAPDKGMQLFADLKVNLGDKVFFDGFGLSTRLAGSVRAIEAPGRPSSGRGEIRLIDGHYQAYGQKLEIETGRLLFNGGLLSEPVVEIRALRKPREDIEVGVFVRGTLDKPLFDLYSTPAMPREAQLSWLVLGRSLEEETGADDQALLANAALSLGLSGTDYLAQNLRNKWGLDEISIGAQPGDEAEQARFTVGKYLSPRLYVSYGVGIFQPGQFFTLLYELGRGFKVSTESGVHTGGDLLYSIERP